MFSLSQITDFISLNYIIAYCCTDLQMKFVFKMNKTDRSPRFKPVNNLLEHISTINLQQ